MSESVKRRREPLQPKPVLDRRMLLEALEEQSILIRESQLDDFYGDLHRLGYPTLRVFARLYLDQERRRLTFDKQKKVDVIERDDEEVDCSKPIDVHKNISFNLKPLPLKFVKFLNRGEFETVTSSLDSLSPSNDKCTTKLAVRLQDNHVIETVIMRHYNKVTGGRVTVCVSSQVGCAMGCTFCATGE